MPEVTIVYQEAETLKALKGLAKSLNFKILSGKEKNRPDNVLLPEEALKKAQNKPYKMKGVTIIPPTVFDKDIDDVTDLFKDVDAAKLRKEAWQRNR
jgi:hypothetical protein